MTRARHRLDLLPLLDVFMVVLFVFATIQEQQLDETSHDAEVLREQTIALEAELARSQQALRARDAELATRARADDDAAQLAALRERLGQTEQALAEVKTAAQATIAGLADGDDPVRRKSVLNKLLDRYGVFEVEIAGGLDDAGAVVNRCCFRTDPLANTWQSCGRIPSAAVDRAAWWAQGGGGLDAALRRTKGGNAMTIVRQDERASYRMASRMEELLRDRFPDHQVYDEGIAVVTIGCGDG